MTVDANCAAIDTDFLIHATSMKKPLDEIIKIISIVFAELDLDVIMHPLLHKNELPSPSAAIKTIFDQGLIGVPTMGDILQGDVNRIALYKFLVLELYKKLTGITLNTHGQDILDFWIRKQSLGEIHSLTMCLICGCGLFLSDDSDSKLLRNIIESSFLGSISVYDREALMNNLQAAGIALSRSDRRAFSHSKYD